MSERKTKLKCPKNVTEIVSGYQINQYILLPWSYLIIELK